MAATTQLDGSKKRKRAPSAPAKSATAEEPKSKHPKSGSSDPPKPQQSEKGPFKHDNHTKTPLERRLLAKEKAEERKKKRKQNYILEKELASLWEEMRSYTVGKEERSKLVSEALRKMGGKLLDIASSHVSARVLQTCVKYCSQAERESVFEALRPHLLALARKKYAVHLVKKILDNATKKQLEGFFSSLHGQVASLLRHTVGSSVVEHAFHLGNGSQKQSLLMELYSTELQLFRDLTFTNSGRLLDVISKLGLQKSTVLHHMTTVIQKLLEKGIVDYSIIHTALVEYFTIAGRSSAADVIRQLVPLLVQGSSSIDEDEQSVQQSSKKRKDKGNMSRVPLLVRMMHTRDGLKIGIVCIKHGNSKERKKIVKGIKGHIRKLALDQYGSLLLVCILSVVDDTILVKKIVIRELKQMLKELVLDRNGRRPILQLLHPLCPRYFNPEDLACLNLFVPSLLIQGEGEAASDKLSDTVAEGPVTIDNSSEDCKKSMDLIVGGKKDQSSRRDELLVKSQLAEDLIETCIENVGELIRSNFGKEVVYEVAVGGANGVLHSLAEKLESLHRAIASQAALSKTGGSEEHVLENFHSSRTIRKLVLDCPGFASILWKMALEGRCEMWAPGHSCKILSAFLESSDPKVRDSAKSELQTLIVQGVLKAPEKK